MAPHESAIDNLPNVPDEVESLLKRFSSALDSNNKEFQSIEEEYDFYRFLVGDIHGIARCKIVTKSAYSRMSTKGPGMTWRCLVLALDSYNNYSFKRTDGVVSDARLMVKHSVPRPLSWAGGGKEGAHSVAAVVCESFWGIDEQPQQACPRFIARRLCEQLEEEHKLRILHASEMEFTIFNESREPVSSEGSFLVSQEFAFHEDELFRLSRACEQAGIPIETLQTEYGPGQFEFVLKPTYGVEGADNEFLFKNTAKELLQKTTGHRSRCTFMSKPISNSVGNGSHYNHSLWRIKDSGDNNDVVEDAMWDSTEECKLTKTAQHWVAGILKHSPALAGLFFSMSLIEG